MSESDVLQQYEEELIQVKELLQEDPTNPEYVQLHNDLIELIEITKQEHQQEQEQEQQRHQEDATAADAKLNGAKKEEETNSSAVNASKSQAVITATGEEHETVFPLSKSSSSCSAPQYTFASSAQASSSASINDTAAAATSKLKPKKITSPSASIPDTFQVPSHLIPLESDTAAEQNRKRRTIKALKRQHKHKIKEVECTNKQQSWQQFSAKASTKKSIKSSSIWRTSESRGVGVVTSATTGGGKEGEGSRASSLNKRAKLG